jgi:long-chain acyl-CoA synthetase
MGWTIANLVRRGAAESAAHAAIRFEGQSCSYAELDDRSSRVAAGLLHEGMAAGDRVALLAKNCPEQLEIILGASKAGVITVPINWRLSPSEVAYILDNCAARLLIVGAEFQGLVEEILGGLPNLGKYLVVDAADNLKGYAQWRDLHDVLDPGCRVLPDDVALLLYTSGTTGRPKGAMLTSQNLFTLLDAVGPMWGLDERTRSIACMPLFHIGGIGWALAALRFRGTVVLVKAFDAEGLLETISRERATHVNLVPAMISALVASPSAGTLDHSSLRMILYGTAPIGKQTLTTALEVFNCAFFQVYGLTETTSAITQLDALDHRSLNDAVLNSAGRPYPWVEIRIVNPGTLAPCETNEPGELWVRSAQNMRGYWRDPEATAATMDGSWLRTGDTGYFDAEGYLYLTDRLKDLIVSGGENIYPAESERILLEHPAVSDVAVIGVPDSRWGETAKAVVVVRPGMTVSDKELVQYVRQRLAHFKCPASVDFVESFPRNAAGKVLKRQLRDPYWQGHTRRIN